MRKFKLILGASILMLLPLGANAAPVYSIHVLDPLSGYGLSHGNAINDFGTVVGCSGTRGCNVSVGATKWRLGRAAEAIAGGKEAKDITNFGNITGIASAPGGSTGFLSERGTVTTLNPLPGQNISQGAAVNNHGLVAGTSHSPSEQAVLWRDGNAVNLDDLHGEAFDTRFVRDMNNSGVIVGVGDPTTGPANNQGYSLDTRTGVLTDFGIYQDSPLLPTLAYAINNWGDATGYAQKDRFGNGEWVMWDETGKHKLAPIATGDNLIDASINDRNQIVANIRTGNDFAPHESLLWDDGEIFNVLDMLVLNPVGWDWIQVSDINNRGWMTGRGSYQGQQRGFLLSTPVPAAFWLFGTALIGFVGLSRRRKVA